MPTSLNKSKPKSKIKKIPEKTRIRMVRLALKLRKMRVENTFTQEYGEVLREMKQLGMNPNANYSFLTRPNVSHKGKKSPNGLRSSGIGIYRLGSSRKFWRA